MSGVHVAVAGHAIRDPPRGAGAVGGTPPRRLPPVPAPCPAQAANAGAAKAAMPFTKTVMLGVVAGAYVGLCAALLMTVGPNCPGIAQSNPGLAKYITAAIGFPFGARRQPARPLLLATRRALPAPRIAGAWLRLRLRLWRCPASRRSPTRRSPANPLPRSAADDPGLRRRAVHGQHRHVRGAAAAGGQARGRNGWLTRALAAGCRWARPTTRLTSCSARTPPPSPPAGCRRRCTRARPRSRSC